MLKSYFIVTISVKHSFHGPSIPTCIMSIPIPQGRSAISFTKGFELMKPSPVPSKSN